MRGSGLFNPSYFIVWRDKVLTSGIVKPLTLVDLRYSSLEKQDKLYGRWVF